MKTANNPAAYGYRQAVIDLALAYYWGENDEDYGIGIYGIEKNDYEASKWLERAANLGNHYCQYLFGVQCYYGAGVHKNYQRAMEWFKKAAKQGNGMSYFYLFNMYINGFGCSKDKNKAMDYYDAACDILNDGNDICFFCDSTDYSEGNTAQLQKSEKVV